MKNILSLLLLAGFCTTAYGQYFNTGVNTANPDSSAVLDVFSTDKGFLIPRLTQTAILAIPNPATGLLVFNTDAQCFWYFALAQWNSLCQTAGSDDWTLLGNAGTSPSTNYLGTSDNAGLSIRTNGTERVHITSTGNVGIGTNNPQAQLHVAGTVFGKMRHITYHTFNVGGTWYSPSSNGTLWLPGAGGDGEDDRPNLDYRNYWVAPYSGRMVKLILQVGPDGGSNPDIIAKVELRVNSNSVVSANNISCNDGQTVTFTAPATGWSFNAGDRMAAGLNYTGTCCYIENTDYYVTIVWEYDVFD